jgi:hypothetical protein
MVAMQSGTTVITPNLWSHWCCLLMLQRLLWLWLIHALVLWTFRKRAMMMPPSCYGMLPSEHVGAALMLQCAMRASVQ